MKRTLEVRKATYWTLERVHSAIGELDPTGEDTSISKAMYIVAQAKTSQDAETEKLYKLAEANYHRDTGKGFHDD
jgi:hypothetical protein